MPPRPLSHHDPWPEARLIFLFRALPLGGWHLGLYARPLLLDQFPEIVVQCLRLCLLGGSATGPSDPAAVVKDIDVSDLAVHHANGLLEAVRQALTHEEVPLVLLVGHLPPQVPHEHADEPRLHRVLLQVDIHPLREGPRALEHLVQARVLARARERRDLLLRPDAREQAHDRDPAAQQRRRVLRRPRRRQREPVQVGEVQRLVALEEARGRDERLALVVLQVRPFAEVGLCDLACSVEFDGSGQLRSFLTDENLCRQVSYSSFRRWRCFS